MNNQVIPKKFLVYGREGCHLCEEMIASLRELQQKKQFELDIINVDNNEQLTQLYGEKVPVLFAVNENKELCHYFLDAGVVDTYLS
ncbi:glutaredoxin family protein [Betaproteobacteria bacterium PRO4]|uniref:glutaredoxin family protein n=1 Tax=Nitrosomonas sp. TaxID=42353 RepID=UPI002566C336|nr:glutaredoxin family protein [Nitrosomonas sp.]MBE7526555.1 glutaredoxin family protein [Burkholderiales bacterium]MDL1866901.1 glutaredoxin family protein [Betaproteobacteria bacterium PRO4]